MMSIITIMRKYPSIALGMILVLLASYAYGLRQKNDVLNKEKEIKEGLILELQDSNDKLVLQLEVQKKNYRTSQEAIVNLKQEIENAKPIIEEKIVYVKEYIKDESVPKCVVNDRWVQLHAKAVSNPYADMPLDLHQ